MTIPEQHVLSVAFEMELHLRWIDRKWYRAVRAKGRYLDLEAENLLILRALSKMRAQVRRASKVAIREEVRKSEAIDRLVDNFIEDEDRFEGWREGQPEFNGAFR